MFTGIIQSIGTVTECVAGAAGARLVIDTALPPEALKFGDSIAVDGCCQTIEAMAGTVCIFHALNEVLNRTIFRSYKPGRRVNIEPALRLGDRLGGHLVQGHVDGVTAIRAIRRREGDIAVTLARPDRANFPLVEKGSIAINGISLTVAELTAEAVTVCIIPHTWANTALQYLAAGAPVNVEADLIGKYVSELLKPYAPASHITMDSLHEAGFF